MIRVIGLGSPFGDDDVGWRVVDTMRKTLEGRVDLVALDRPGASLVDRLIGVDHLVLVDALQTTGRVGLVRRLDPAALAAPALDCGSHQLRLADQLALAGALGCRPCTVELWAITIASIEQRSAAAGLAVIELATGLAARLAAEAPYSLASATGRRRRSPA